jgi:hypothetical protein
MRGLILPDNRRDRMALAIIVGERWIAVRHSIPRTTKYRPSGVVGYLLF